jgi:hypothetical protein
MFHCYFKLIYEKLFLNENYFQIKYFEIGQQFDFNHVFYRELNLELMLDCSVCIILNTYLLIYNYFGGDSAYFLLQRPTTLNLFKIIAKNGLKMYE